MKLYIYNVNPPSFLEFLGMESILEKSVHPFLGTVPTKVRGLEFAIKSNVCNITISSRSDFRSLAIGTTIVAVVMPYGNSTYREIPRLDKGSDVDEDQLT